VVNFEGQWSTFAKSSDANADAECLSTTSDDHPSTLTTDAVISQLGPFKFQPKWNRNYVINIQMEYQVWLLIRSREAIQSEFSSRTWFSQQFVVMIWSFSSWKHIITIQLNDDRKQGHLQRKILPRKRHYRTRELITARGHMMPPPLHVCNGLASPADTVRCMYCEICEVTRYVAAPVWTRFEFSVLCCLLSWYSFAQNVISSSIVTTFPKFHRNPFSIRAKR